MLKDIQSQYLKLYNLCLNDMDPLTYKGLFRTVIQLKKNDKAERVAVFRKDYKMIGLILEKFIQKKLKPAERKSLLRELYVVVRNPYSMKAFLGVPNYLHFLNELLSLHSEEDGSDGEIRKIFRRFISFTLFEEELHVFDLISLIEFDSSFKSKDSKVLLSKKEEMPTINESSASDNIYKLLKFIEAAISEFKEQLLKSQAQGANTTELPTSLNEKTLETIHSNKAFILNFTQFIYYYEYFLAKNHKRLEEQEKFICQFTVALFEFMYDTQILLVTYPSLKHVSGDINLGTITKRFENVCYRNGGPFLSILTSIFTVLKNTNTEEKMGLLKCIFTVLALLRSKKSPEGDMKVLFTVAFSSKQQVHKDKNPQGNESTTKKHTVLSVRQSMTPSLIEVQSNEKSPDLLVYKVSFAFRRNIKMMT